MSTQVKPFLKWAGGKGKLLDQILPYFPITLEGRNYIEPFVGGGAVLFWVVQNLNPKSCTILDINPDLINTWREIRDNVEEVIPLLSLHKLNHNVEDVEERKAYYYKIRSERPSNNTESAARFIYLNKTCFNGMHRLNSKGEFNIPIGSYKMPTIFDAEHLRGASKLLEGITIEVSSFEGCEHYIKDNDFVYLDPPYEPLSITSNFTRYGKEDFTQRDQKSLCTLIEKLTPKVECILSNSTALLIEELYSSPVFYKNYVLCSRSINSVGSRRGKIKELLITNRKTKQCSMR